MRGIDKGRSTISEQSHWLKWQGHRFIKRIIRPMLGFKSFRSAQATLAGIELWHMLKKSQGKSSLAAWEQF
jgi:putative transposase